MQTRYFIGLDLGSRHDFTALAVLERAEFELHLRHLERVPLESSLLEIVDRVHEVIHTSPLEGQCELVVNAAAGRRIIELLQRAPLGCRVWPVTVTSAQREKIEGDWAHVPNRDLLLGLRTLLLEGALKLAKALPYGADLLRQIPNMRITVTPPENKPAASWREGPHDDLAFAVALACWGEKRSRSSAELQSAQSATAVRPLFP